MTETDSSVCCVPALVVAASVVSFTAVYHLQVDPCIVSIQTHSSTIIQCKNNTIQKQYHTKTIQNNTVAFKSSHHFSVLSSILTVRTSSLPLSSISFPCLLLLYNRFSAIHYFYCILLQHFPTSQVLSNPRSIILLYIPLNSLPSILLPCLPSFSSFHAVLSARITIEPG